MIKQLIYNEDTDRYELDGEDLHCGDCIEVLVFGNQPKWIETRIECDDEGWYLVGIADRQLGGLFARR